MSTIGSRIKNRREELNMSQDELAKKLGYESRSSINKIELDQRSLPQSKIKAVADALGTTPSYIMGWGGSIQEELEELKRKWSKAAEFLSQNPDDEDAQNEAFILQESIEDIELAFSLTARGKRAQTTSARIELSSRERRLVAAYRNAPDNIKTGVDAILEPFAEKTDVSVG